MNPTKSEAEAKDVPSFFADVRALVSMKRIEDARFFVYDHVDRWLCSDQIEKCDVLLRVLDFDLIHPDVLMAFVAVTIPALDVIPFGRTFIERAKKKMEAHVGVEKASRIFAHLS